MATPPTSKPEAFSSMAAEDAFRGVSKFAAARWPSRQNSERLEPVCLPSIKPNFSLQEGASVFGIGSCFARHIERALRDHGFRVPAMDFNVPLEELWAGTRMVPGILNKYTPFSMLNEVKFALGETDGSEFLIETSPGQFWDGQLHTNRTVSLERGLERRQELRTLYRDAILQSPVVVITLGLVECWWDAQEKCYLNETVLRRLVDKYPGRFEFEVLSPDKTQDAVTQLLLLLHQANPQQRALLTVSPIPLSMSFSGEDVITANTYSKSILRVAAEVSRRRFDHVDYYPSFESITHSDRTRTWEEDLIHVQPDIIGLNVERMIREYLPEQEPTE